MTQIPHPSPAEDYIVAVQRAVEEENLIYSYYAVMMAVHRRGEESTLAGIAIDTGKSYHAVRQITERTHYLRRVDGVPVMVRLTEAGVEKLGRISKRLSRLAP